MVREIFKTYKLWWIAIVVIFVYFGVGMLVALATPWSYLYEPFSFRFIGNLAVILFSGVIACLSASDGNHLKVKNGRW